MEVLFLYHRLYQTAQRQLESLRRLDFGTLERLTKDREKITADLCESLRHRQDRPHESPLTGNVRNRIRELTARTLDIDSEIKELLLEELRERTLELAGTAPRSDSS